MTDVVDPAPLVEAAQKAASDGDYLAAERLLREVVSIQESSLGSSHPDLASTLNNLAFVYEQTNKVDEAERGYRRAHKIAVASLPPRHPFIATSLKNLVDFCAAHDIPIWKPASTRSDDETPVADDAGEEFEVETAPPPDVRDEPVVVTTRWTARMFVVAALVLAVVVVLAFIRRSPETTNTPSPETRQESSPTPAIPATTPALPPESQPAVVVRELRPDTAKSIVSVLNAQLCSALEKRGSPDWQCTPVTGDARPGAYFFYTRLLANGSSTVEHRWYREGRVHQVMRLRVTPGAASGYRTFSTNTISLERAGEWKVELHAADGSLLQEISFVVR